MQRRSGLKRTRIRRTSKKKQAENRARKPFLMELERIRGNLCEAQGQASDQCQGIWSDGHEIVKRSAGGDPLNPNNVLLICRLCHDWIEANPALARERGLARKGIT